jgi:hypothetical protein
MRKYKFRGKRIDNGEWVYGYIVITDNGDAYIYNTFAYRSYNVQVRRSTVGQHIYTWEGQDIYEDDELYIDDLYDDTGYSTIVKSRGKIFVRGQDYDYTLLCWAENLESVRVTGNIHDQKQEEFEA